VSDPRESRADLLTTVIRRPRPRADRGAPDHRRADPTVVLAEPEEVLEVRPGRVVAQRMIAAEQDGDGGRKEYLFRVVVDIDRDPPELVTAHRTSKVRKYRSTP